MEAFVDCGTSTRKGTRRAEDRFCCVGFWPTVEVQEPEGLVSTEIGNFASVGYVENIDFSSVLGQPIFHSVMRQKNFCSVWEAQDRALLLHEAIQGQFIDIEFYKTHRTFVPQSSSLALEHSLTKFAVVEQPLPDFVHCRQQSHMHDQGPPVGPPPDVRDNPEWRDPNRPHFDDSPIWVHHLWRRLEEEGIVEDEEEGPVAYFNTYYISHHTNQRQDFGRQLRLGSAFQTWATEIRQLWHDFFDHSIDFEAMLVSPESPVISSEGSSGTLLVVQHPNPERAACLTTALIPDIPTFRVIEVAHSFETISGQRALLYYAGVLDLCDHRIEQYVGECTIRVGRYHYPPNRPVRVHEGLGILVDVPPPMSQQDWEDRLVRQLHAQAGQVQQPRFEDGHDSDETGLLARSPIQAFNVGGNAEASSMSASSTSDVSSHSRSSSYVASDAWYIVIVFSLTGGERELEVPWHNGEELFERVAHRFGIVPDDIVAVHTVLPCPPDIVQDDRRALLLQLPGDPLQPADQKLVLVDIEYKEDVDGPASRIDRRVRRIPCYITRASVIRLCGYDGHCSQDPARCWVWLNDEYIPEDSPILQFAHGNYLKLAIPAHTDRQICDTGESYWPMDLDHRYDFDLSGQEDGSDESNLLQSAIIHHKLDQPDVCEAPIFEACLEPAAPNAWIRPHGRNEDFQLRRDPLWDLWNRPRLRTRGIANEPVMIFDTWYLSSLGFPRCSFSRAVALDEDIDSWLVKIRTVWRDRLHPHMPVELAIVNPPISGTTHGGHFILLQSVSPEEKATILSSYWTQRTGDLHDRFAQLVPRRLSYSSLLQFNDLDFVCSHGDYHCSAHVGDQLFEENEAWPIYHGMHIEVVISHGVHPSASSSTQAAVDMDETAEPEHQAFQFQASAPAFDPALPAIETMTQFVQALYPVWFSLAFTWEGEGYSADVVTWFVDHRNPERRACHQPRIVQLSQRYQFWENDLRHAWRDLITEGHPLDFYLVHPQPPAQGDVLPHVILVQNSHELLATSVLTVYETEPPNSRLATQTAITTLAQIHLEHLLQGLGLQDRCLLPSGDLQCAAWHENEGITLTRPLRGRNGLSLLLELRTRLLRAMSHDDEEEASLLQTGPPITDAPLWTRDTERLTGGRMASNRRPVSLVLEELLSEPTPQLADVPGTTAVELLNPDGLLLPSPLEVRWPGQVQQVQEELLCWGHDCVVIDCDLGNRFLCISELSDQPVVHYLFWPDVSSEESDCHFHTASAPLCEIGLMRYLCALGYPRAVIIDQKPIAHNWFKIVFHHREPEIKPLAKKSKSRSPWPANGNHCRTTQPLVCLAQNPSDQETCRIQTTFTVEDLRHLFQSSLGVLCEDFSELDISADLRQVLDQYEFRPLRDVSDLDHYDRLLLFTDGSSMPSMKGFAPQQADELGLPDTWSMVVAAEIFHEHFNEVVILGWSAHPVRYDAQGAAYYGIQRIGSDMSERAGLIGAALWRLGLNHSIATVFCTDSETGGNQAFGHIGTSDPDESYRLMRSLFQTLELGLPRGHLVLHHIRSHVGEMLNEIADIAAKQEMSKSLHLARQKLDMQTWIPKLLELWSLFGHRLGLPAWSNGCLHAPAPDLPDSVPLAVELEQSTKSTTWRFGLSLASANVQSLYKGPTGHAGKLHFLQAQMRTYQLNILAVQEARSDAGMSQAGKVLRFCSGHQDGHFGMEIWVDLTVPYAQSTCGRRRHFDSSHFQCVHHDARTLLLRCDALDLSFWLLAIHAPHGGHAPADREQWWQHLRTTLLECLDGAPLFLLGDANASPGPRDDEVVLCDGFSSSANTEALRALLVDFDLFLPATSTVHTGSRTTSWTISIWAICNGLTELPRHAGRFARHKPKLLDYVHGPDIRHKLLDFAVQPWHVDVETQANGITEHLRNVLQKPPDRPESDRMKKPYMTHEAWELRTLKLHYKKVLREIRKRLRFDGLARVFRAWRSQHDLPELPEYDAYLISLRVSSVHITARYLQACRSLKLVLMQSKQKALLAAVEQFDEQTPASAILQRLRCFVGPTNPKKNKKKTLPIVKDEHGEICQLPSDSLAVWVKFFQQMEGSVRMSFHDLREQWIRELDGFSKSDFEVPLASFPSLTDLELAMRRVPIGRARGPDGLPGELLHHQPAAVAQLMMPQLLKMIAHGHEHLGFKGGRLAPAYKGKGPWDQCSSFRSLLVSNHLGKVLHRTIRQQQMTLYERFMQAQQTGGRRRVPVQFPLHQVRAFTRHAKTSHMSFGILFLDLTEAFYTILREVPLGGCPSDEVVAHVMRRLNMPASSLHDIHALLGEESAVAQAGMTSMHQDCVRAVHTSTHFWLGQQSDVSRTCMGTRPGDSFADIVFGFTWSLVLHKLQEYMLSIGALTELKEHVHLPLFGSDTLSGNTSSYMGPTWMDDTAVCLLHHSGPQLVHQARCVASFLLDLCTHHCLKPNLSAGKTEILLSFRGVGSRRLKTEHYGPNAPMVLHAVGEHQSYDIKLVKSYKHLGGQVHHTADQALEVRQRTAIAHTAMNSHRRVLFQNPHIALAKRVQLFDSIVISKLLYGAESWISNDQRTMQKFSSAVFKLYRRLLKISPDRPVSDEDILAQLDALSPHDLLRRARLRYLVTLTHSGVPGLWDLLACDSQWLALIESDITWMWDQLSHASSLPDPRIAFGAWLGLLQHRPGYWKRLVRRACTHSTLQRRRVYQVRVFHQQALARLRGLLPAEPPPDECPLLESQHYFGCIGCGLRCKSRAGESAHMCRKHGIVSSLRRLFDQPVCPACLRDFHTLQKLKAHLYYVPACRDQLRSRGMNCHVVPGAGSREDLERARLHDRYLPPLLCHGPHHEQRRVRDFVDIEDIIYEGLIDAVSSGLSASAIEEKIRACAQGVAVSWTKFVDTICFFEDNYGHEDAEYFQLPEQTLRHVLSRLRDPESWDFFAVEKEVPTLGTISQLEADCVAVGRRLSEAYVHSVPRLYRQHRVVLHAYAGRRRVGDLQYFLDLFAAKHSKFILHVISLDIIIDAQWGDVSNPQTCAYWIDAIRKHWVVAFVGGPPCESWSIARGKDPGGDRHGTFDGAPLTSPPSRLPRIIRTAALPWGLDCVSLKELQQLCMGNTLLFFAILAVLELAAENGYAILEHPAEPEQDPAAASIWRLEIIQTLLQLPHVSRLRLAQGLLGAKSPKPTHLLLVNLPNLLPHLHQGRVRTELPSTVAIGKDGQGCWNTATLKEYPPAFCRCMAKALIEVFDSDESTSSASEPDANFLARCAHLEVTDYGDTIGADFCMPGVQ
eukprot:s1783_g15.t1